MGTWSKFLSKVVPNRNNDCIEWQNSLDTSGYGLFRYKKKLYKAHRFIYTQVKGEIPPDKIVRHACDNRKCVNPDHLLIGTKKDNAQDRENRQRSNRRTRDNTHGVAKINSEKLNRGVYMFKYLNYSRAAVAKYWKVSYPHGCKLIKANYDAV